jgi:hypothetical protein
MCICEATGFGPEGFERRLAPVQSFGFDILFGRGLTDELAGDLNRIPNLRGLNLAESSLTDAGLRSLASHPTVRGIILSQTAITDDGVRQLRRTASLQRLSVSETRVTGDGIASLLVLPNLELIDASNTRISHLVLDHGFPKLFEIAIKGCPIKDLHISNLPRLNGLFVAPFSDVRMEGVTVDIKDLPQLKYVVLAAQISPQIGPSIVMRHLPQVEYLELRCQIRDADLLAFDDLPRLRHLNVAWLEVTDLGLSRIGAFSQLGNLRLVARQATGGKLTSEGFAFLTGLQCLRTLDVESEADGGIPQIGDVKSLNELHLTGACSCLETLAPLVRLKSLKRLSLRNASRKISNGELEAIGTITSLQEIEIAYRESLIGPEIRSLRHSLPNAKLLSNGKEITGDGVANPSGMKKIP